MGIIQNCKEVDVEVATSKAVLPKVNPPCMVFDVESIGLHGEGFAVGYVVVDPTGVILEEYIYSCNQNRAKGRKRDRDWILDNIPTLPVTHNSPEQVRKAFWAKWLKWKEKGAVLAADCPWPVEARFLAQAIDDAKGKQDWNGPYPLIDVGSVLYAKGYNPLATYTRNDNEYPIHNPLMDARQSARLLINALNGKGLIDEI